jgi:3-methyladenine DNA glycosylase AlkD
MKTIDEIIAQLKTYANPHTVESMTRFGIHPANALGISIPVLRKLANNIGKNHALALQLWNTGIHEARIVASLIDDPALVTEQQMDEWTAGFDSWDVCDLVCLNLFDKTKYTHQKITEWTSHNREFERRAGFVLIAVLAVHDKKASDKDFAQYFPLIEAYAEDDRNFVKKAVNWALRQIGKRNAALGKKALIVAQKLKTSTSKSARWIGSDAYRELINKKHAVS